MKLRNLLACVLLSTMMGCVTKDNLTGEEHFDPLASGEVIGYTYILTKDQMSTQDLDNIKAAYSAFSYVAQLPPNMTGSDIKVLLLETLDKEVSKTHDAKTVAAAKILVTMYWSRLQSKYNIDAMIPTEQLAMLRQVYIGIERGIGNQ